MRVLFLLHSHPDLQAGGTEIFARDLFRTLRDRGVSGLLLAGTAAHQRPPSPGTPFQSIGMASDEILAWTGGFDPFFMSQIDLHGLSQPISELLRSQRPDIVHVHHVMTLGVEVIDLIRRVLPDTRVVMTLHDYYPLCANDGQMVTRNGVLCHAAYPDACRSCFPDRSLTDFKLRSLHINNALDQVDHFIAPSHFLRERFVSAGFSPDRISVIPNGLPVTEPVPARREIRRDRFAFFGHINPYKGAITALEASALLSQQSVVHGLSLHGGTEHQTAETLSRFLDARAKAPDARYVGGYRRKDLPRLIADVDWVVFPSQWWENAPLVVNEAFQHWRPVLCSAVGGALELVKDGVNGLHFPPGDAALLAATMRRAIEEPGLWQHLVDGIVPPVCIEKSASKHLEFYRDLLATSSGGVPA